MERIFFYCAINYLTGLQSAQIREDTGPKRSLKTVSFSPNLQIFASEAGSSLSIQTSTWIKLGSQVPTVPRRPCADSHRPSHVSGDKKKKKKPPPTISLLLCQLADKAKRTAPGCNRTQTAQTFLLPHRKKGGPLKQKTRRRIKKKM